MEGSAKKNITTYEELMLEKQRLKMEISDQEFSLKENPVYKIATSLFQSKSSNPFTHPLTFARDMHAGKNLKLGIEGIISAVLLANRTTRKYFIMYTVAKEMIPFTIGKINELIKK
ncbi:MAG: hypothetical protein U5K51_15925 [Flavobacteriaceae bacterium]|nr:hypothetical protein [Flavobacteriaceae bacterium]